MIDLTATYHGIPVFYIVPILFFGPILIWMLYMMGIKHIIYLPGEVIAKRKREREEREQLMDERRKKMGQTEKVRKRETKYTAMSWVGQGLFYALFALPIYLWSADPAYRLTNDGEAQIKLSLSKPGDHKTLCVKMSREELRKLPPQKRGKQKCGRERWPVYIEFYMDGELLYAKSIKPSGVASDGPSLFYQKFQVPAGTHKISVRMRETGREEGFDSQIEETVNLKATQVLAVDYHTEESRFILR